MVDSIRGLCRTVLHTLHGMVKGDDSLYIGHFQLNRARHALFFGSCGTEPFTYGAVLITGCMAGGGARGVAPDVHRLLPVGLIGKGIPLDLFRSGTCLSCRGCREALGVIGRQCAIGSGIMV